MKAKYDAVFTNSLPTNLPGCPSPTDSEENRNVLLFWALHAIFKLASFLLLRLLCP